MILALAALAGDIPPNIGPPVRPNVGRLVATVGDGLECEAGYEALLRKLAVTPGAEAMTVPAWERLGVYSVKQERAVYAFTIPGHAAHPALVKREIVTRAGRLYYQLSACGYGDAAAFRALAEAYNRLNERAAKSVNERLKQRQEKR